MQKDVQVLCEALNLPYEPQDWGIANADGNRLAEFINFYNSHPELNEFQRFELGELILASANEAMIAGMKPDRGLASFLISNQGAFETHLNYWKELRDVTEFPIADWLRSVRQLDR